MITVPQELRVAVVGPGATRAHDVFTCLADAGFHGRGFLRFTRLLEAKREWCATILLADPQRPYAEEDLPALQELAVARPLIVASASIDMDLVRSAAALGACDIVLRGDALRLADSVRRGVAAWAVTDGDIAGDVERQLMRRVFDLTPNFVSIRDGSGRFTIVSQTLADLYGTTVEQMAGKTPAAYSADASEAARELADDAQVLRSKRSHASTREIVDSAGRKRLLQVVKRPITLDDGRAFVMSVGVDVTNPRRAESTLAKTNDFLKNVLETISDAVFALDVSGKFTLLNRRLSQLTGYKHHQLIGMPFTRIFAPESLAEVERVLQGLAADPNAEKRFEAHVVRADGNQRIVTGSLTPLRSGERVIGIVGTAVDVTERKAAEQRIEHLAYHDPLTNLPNRRLLGDRLTMAMSQAQRDKRMLALLFVDLDRFKSINDSLGHRVGDALLQELGARLRHCVRGGDTVARMGGDEFVFLLPAVQCPEDAVTVARKVLDAVRKPFAFEGREFVVTACIGISLYPQHALDAETLIKHADTALFESKRRGSDTYEIFEPSMSARSMDHFLLENELRRAIAGNELALAYQPIVDMRTERIVALEALVRWHHPERGMLFPDEFIRLAEETGLIVPLGEWVLREACRQNRDWQRRGILSVPVAVNISARQFDVDFAGTVAGALQDSGLDPEYLELELTETILMESAAASSMTVDALKELGTRISIDDFGTGYSSLGYLERFPIDALKIDRSFMPHDPLAPGAGVIAGTIISMARTLGIDVIAEGVETRDQRDFLLARGCGRAQGHYYWPALDADSIEELARGDTRDGILA